jgi:hypothetical protein
VHARDVLQHLKAANAVKMICNIFASQAKYFITTTFLNETAPAGLNFGGLSERSFFMGYNLDLAPFEFGKAESCHVTHPDNHERDYTCVYDLKLPWVQDFRQKKCLQPI